MTAPDLLIPVYLNQRVVFDLVAMLRGGIATVTKVSEAAKETSVTAGEATGAFGLSQAIASLLRIDLSGKVAASEEGATVVERSEERIHTPSSLFFVLRNLMLEQELLKRDRPDLKPRPGDFIEFTASLQRNPLLEGLESLKQITALASTFASELQGARRGKKGPQRQTADLKTTQRQMDSLLEALKTGGTLDLTSEGLASGYSAVVTVESQYLNDPTLADLVDGTFRVVGKVIRVVQGGGQPISLLRKAAVGRMPPGVLETLRSAFKNLETDHSFSVPRMEWEIGGPAFQLLPLAIFA